MPSEAAVRFLERSMDRSDMRSRESRRLELARCVREDFEFSPAAHFSINSEEDAACLDLGSCVLTLKSLPLRVGQVVTFSYGRRTWTHIVVRACEETGGDVTRPHRSAWRRLIRCCR